MSAFNDAACPKCGPRDDPEDLAREQAEMDRIERDLLGHDEGGEG